MVENVKNEMQTNRVRTRRALKRKAIIDATAAQLAESGLSATTLDRVGERVGLSKAALYYYVDSRDELLALLLDRLLAGIRAEAGERTADSSSPLDQLRSLLRSHIEQAVLLPEGQLIVSNVDALAAAPATAASLHAHELAARALVEAAIAAGELREVDSLVATTVLFGASNTMCRTNDPDGTRPLAEMIDATLDLTLGAWVPTPR